MILRKWSKPPNLLLELVSSLISVSFLRLLNEMELSCGDRATFSGCAGRLRSRPALTGSSTAPSSRGEATGHSHRVEDLATAQVFQGRDELYLRVIGDAARIVHQEHGPITLPRGTYRVWKQREYAPGTIRWVVD